MARTKRKKTLAQKKLENKPRGVSKYALKIEKLRKERNEED